MKKIRLVLILMLVVTLLSACTPQAEANKAPTVVGVKDVQCLVNSTVDFLDGVAALDKEDGDITPNLSITVDPHVDVSSDGYATFTEQGEYTVNYEITDSDGRTAQKRAYVDVVDRETYHAFDRPEEYSVETVGTAKVTFNGMMDGAYTIKAQGGEIAEDVKIVRTFTVSAEDGVTRQYVFSTQLHSNVGGKVLVLCNGELSAELAVTAGDNDLQFSCTCADDETQTTCEVEVALCVGALGNMELVLGNTFVTYPQEIGKKVTRIDENFSFAGTVSNRVDKSIESKITCNSWAGDNGKSAKFEVTKSDDISDSEIWKGGMFVNTGLQLRENTSYKVSFDVSRVSLNKDNPNETHKFNVMIQRDQWNETKLEAVYGDQISAEDLADGKSCHFEREFTNDVVGPLWLYVQAACQLQEITISNLEVVETFSATATDNFAIGDFTHSGDYEFHSELGHITYKIHDFSSDDPGANSVTSPNFYVSGSGANYVIQFKIKASAPIEFIVAGPVADGWDPALLWQKPTISANVEYTFAFACNGGNAAERWYRLVWQFGSSVNAQYHDVTIEIYDIRVCKRDAVLDS